VHQAQELLGAAMRWPQDPSGSRRVKSHVAGLRTLLPLPAPAEGLCVFSQDARIVRKLQEDAQLIEQEFVAEVSGAIRDRGLERMSGGLAFEGRKLPAVRASWQSEHRLRIATKGFPLDLVPWMCEQVGLRLVSLKRIRIGRVPMAGLPQGQWRYRSASERF
jgi:23S rRNA pseudouridine2604 synthase